MDILAHQYPLINKVQITEGVRMLSLEDIGAMKLNAILYNGTRLKDFVDAQFIQHVPLHILTEAFEKKYPDVNRQMADTGLLYYQDINMKRKFILLAGIFFGKKLQTGCLKQSPMIIIFF